MSIKQRLNKLEEAIGGGHNQCRCTHKGLNVWFGDDGSGLRTEYRDPPAELPRCACGGDQILLKVVYGDPVAAEAMK